MFYHDFQDLKLSALGFGAMRLPLREDGGIDREQVREMVALAMEGGVNYFDTAYPYHGGQSETVLGEALADYPRESFFLATKYPGHQLQKEHHPEIIFENQLKKCGVEYFDFYLLHNVNDQSLQVYMDPKWGILDYFKKQKRLGRIRHLGFSCHAGTEGLREFLDYCGEDMEFCQIQLNYLDWTLQKAEEKVRLLAERHIPIWVMEPLRGGRLAKENLPENPKLSEISENSTPAELGFRWLMAIPQVTVVLSGMSSSEQMRQNLRTFSEACPLSSEQFSGMLEAAETMKNSVPCTGCRYCTEGCPAGLDIPRLIALYNELRFGMEGGMMVSLRLEAFPEDKQPDCCLGCGACASACPQNIDVPAAMREFSELAKKIPSWKKVCEERNRIG